MFKGHYPESQKEIFSFYTHQGPVLRGLLSIPHSGEEIPQEFTSYLVQDIDAIGKDVDYKVHELVDIAKLNQQGISVLVAHVHRVAVDLNRSSDLALLNWKVNTFGTPLVIATPNEAEAQKILGRYYHPYYHVLKAIIEEGLKFKDPFPVIDLHSMPSRPTAYHLQQNPKQKEHRPDFCISNRKGATSTDEYLDFLQKKLEGLNHEVYQNDPYVGGHITEWVGKFKTQMAQIEINRSIYMDEKKRSLVPHLANSLKVHLTQVLIDQFQQFGA